MRINYTRAIVAGIGGTLAFDIAGFALTGNFWDIPAILGSRLFGEGALVAGVIAHYSNGVLLSIIYAAITPSLIGNRWMRAMTYVTAETIFGVWLFMAPLLGAGPLGLKLGVLFPVISLLRHWAYGAVLAALCPLDGTDELQNTTNAIEMQPA